MQAGARAGCHRRRPDKCQSQPFARGQCFASVAHLCNDTDTAGPLEQRCEGTEDHRLGFGDCEA
jgi:hypothetical protein